MRVSPSLCSVWFWFGLCLATNSASFAADPIYSGPQPGEKTTGFRVLDLVGDKENAERDPIAENTGAPTAFVFLHAVERSLVPLLRTVDEYGALRKDRLKTEIIFLFRDRLEGESRGKAVLRSLQLQSRVGLSLDGQEGPGNYGLNRECMMTVIVANQDRVTASFALVQPGIADAPKVLAALAQAAGDPTPPTAEELLQRHQARTGSRDRPGAMARESTKGEARPIEPLDPTRFDLSTETGLREAVRALLVEVRQLRNELEQGRQKAGPASTNSVNPTRPKEDFPGAPPTDPQLLALLRRFIQKTNDDATVDGVLKEVNERIQGQADLRQQAIDGWTRILHFGDRYGTDYARRVGKEFLERLKREAAGTKP